MDNSYYLHYTYMHRKAFLFTLLKVVRDERDRNALMERARRHDLDKSFLYTLIDKKAASKYHRETSNHHMENDGRKSRLDLLEAIIDYECAGYTKADKPRNAYDTVMEFHPNHSEELMALMEELGIAYSYQNTPEDEEWKAWKKKTEEECGWSEISLKDEDVMAEIYEYVLHFPEKAKELLEYAKSVREAQAG